MNRRQFLAGTSIALFSGCSSIPRVPAEPLTMTLVATPAQQSLVGGDYGTTDLWSYNGAVPGPALRTSVGRPMTVTVRNQLPEPTTVHWHGLRIANAMDGMPYVSQPPIEPGQSFVYRFTPPDAGTYWYHSHYNSSEQVGRGLYGALIVEEQSPVPVDREITWILDDWLLNRDAGIIGDYDEMRPAAHAGRIGNTVTINGAIRESQSIRAGERIRLRLINAANARFFSLGFGGHNPWIVAIDGQPVTPHQPPDGRVTIGPAMRTDVILDAAGKVGERYPVTDAHYRDAFRLLDFNYTEGAPTSDFFQTDVKSLEKNSIAEPNLENAPVLDVVLEGGVHGGMQSARLHDEIVDIRELIRKNKIWAMNGVVGDGHAMTPILRLQLGNSYRFRMHNQTRFPHPMHLHGHHFRVLSRNDVPTRYREWQDTVIVSPDETVEVAFVADNPGHWMFHCHVLSHQRTGMSSIVEVA